MLSLLLQAAAPAPSGGLDQVQILLIGGAFVSLYFFIIRPQSKKAKEQTAYQETLSSGDKVVMNSGMHGKITKMDEKTVTIEVDNNVRLKFEKGFINMELSKSLNPAPVVIDKEK